MPGRSGSLDHVVEMEHMVAFAVVPHLLEKSGERGTILSRSLKTWGSSESGLSERIASRVDTQTITATLSS